MSGLLSYSSKTPGLDKPAGLTPKVSSAVFKLELKILMLLFSERYAELHIVFRLLNAPYALPIPPPPPGHHCLYSGFKVII